MSRPRKLRWLPMSQRDSLDFTTLVLSSAIQRLRCAAAAALALREPNRDSEWAVGTSAGLDGRLKELQDVRMGHELTAASVDLE